MPITLAATHPTTRPPPHLQPCQSLAAHDDECTEVLGKYIYQNPEVKAVTLMAIVFDMTSEVNVFTSGLPIVWLLL